MSILRIHRNDGIEEIVEPDFIVIYPTPEQREEMIRAFIKQQESTIERLVESANEGGPDVAR